MSNNGRQRVLGLAALAMLAACTTSPHDAPPGVRFIVHASQYARTDTITAAVINGSLVNLSYGSVGCNVGMQRRVEGGWGDLQAFYFAPGESVACDAAGHGLRPGGEQRVSQPVREWMGAGEYRLTFYIYWPRTDGRSYTLVSNTFTVVPE